MDIDVDEDRDRAVDPGRERWDVIVVGGGAAGLAGAVALLRSRRSVLVLDAGRPRNATAGHVHNFLTRDGTPPAELLAAGRAEVAAYGGSVQEARVEEVGGRVDDFTVRLAGQAEPLRARRLLLATGVRDELPDLPGLAERWGRDVLHCPYCHGFEVRDQALGVLGSPMAVHQALLFSQLSDDVVLFTHRSPAPEGEDADRLAARGVRVVPGEVAGVEVRDDALAGVRLATGETVPRQALVVAPRFTADAGPLAALGLAPEDLAMHGTPLGTRVPTDPMTGATAVPGVYAAGNVTDPTAQVIGAANAGLRTGAQINAELVMADAARVPGSRRERPGDGDHRAGRAAGVGPVRTGERDLSAAR